MLTDLDPLASRRNWLLLALFAIILLVSLKLAASPGHTGSAAKKTAAKADASPATAAISPVPSHPQVAAQSTQTAPMTLAQPAPAAYSPPLPSPVAGAQAALPVTDSPAAKPVAYRVIAGSTAPFTDSNGNLWAPETGFVSGGTDVVSAGAVVNNTADQGLYRSQRVGNSFTLTFTVPNGNYLLALLFAQVDGTVTGPGQRVCTVTAGESMVLDHFDVFAFSGLSTPNTQVIPVTVTGGSLVLAFTGSGSSGTAAVAAVQLGWMPPQGGITASIPGDSTPQKDVPAPPWASGSVPTDD